MRKLSVTSLAVAFLAACGSNPLGRPCKADNDCGPGFDCYPDLCVQVCTKADECPQGQTCYRYHCVVPMLSQGLGPTAPPPARMVNTPPLPDTTAAELRAIRRELEVLLAEQAKLTAAVEELKKSGVRADKPVAPVKEPAKKP